MILCIIACLKEHISRMDNLEGLTSGQLIVTVKNAFKGSFNYTIRRWMKGIFALIILLVFIRTAVGLHQQAKPRNLI